MKSTPSFILCATDFSPRAVAAATVAAQLARGRSEKLRLVHVSAARTASALGTARKRLADEVQRLAGSGTEVEPFFLQGARPTAVLVDHIRGSHPELVVVGSDAKGAFDRWAIGSFSEKVAESSPVPTLVIRNSAGFDRWDWTKHRLAILLAVDLYATSDAVLRWAKHFQLAGPCDLVVCHINARMPTVEESAVAPGRPVNPPELQARLERELRKKVRDQIGDDAGTMVVRPFFGDPAPCIVEIAGETRAHVIAVGTHQRHGLGRLARFSVSRELLHGSGMNVMCVPVTAEFDPRDAHLPDLRRVLVATDFSEVGNTAIPFACGACAVGGQVKLLHVAMPQFRRSRIDRTIELREKLRGLIPNEFGARGQPPLCEAIEERDVAAAICAEAEKFSADLVCLASHGLGASRALHGSVTKAVLKKIRRPLLVVRRADE